MLEQVNIKSNPKQNNKIKIFNLINDMAPPTTTLHQAKSEIPNAWASVTEDTGFEGILTPRQSNESTILPDPFRSQSSTTSLALPDIGTRHADETLPYSLAATGTGEAIRATVNNACNFFRWLKIIPEYAPPSRADHQNQTSNDEPTDVQHMESVKKVSSNNTHQLTEFVNRFVRLDVGALEDLLHKLDQSNGTILIEIQEIDKLVTQLEASITGLEDRISYKPWLGGKPEYISKYKNEPSDDDPNEVIQVVIKESLQPDVDTFLEGKNKEEIRSLVGRKPSQLAPEDRHVQKILKRTIRAKQQVTSDSAKTKAHSGLMEESAPDILENKNRQFNQALYDALAGVRGLRAKLDTVALNIQENNRMFQYAKAEFTKLKDNNDDRALLEKKYSDLVISKERHQKSLQAYTALKNRLNQLEIEIRGTKPK